MCCLGYQAARGDIFCPHSRVSLPRNTPVAPTHEEPGRKKPPCIMLQAPSSTSTTKENRHCMLDQGRATCISSPMPLPLCPSCGSSRSFRDCLPHHFYHIHTHTQTHTHSLSLSLSLSLPSKSRPRPERASSSSPSRACRRLYDLDPFEWEDKSEALDMLKNGVRFHSFTPHAGPDTYTGDMEKTVWWKERGLDRTGGRAILRNKDSLSMSKDIRVRRNGRHRCEFFTLPPSRPPIPLHLHAMHLARPTC